MHATAVTASQSTPAGQLSVRTMASCYNCCVHSRVHSTFRTWSSTRLLFTLSVSVNVFRTSINTRGSRDKTSLLTAYAWVNMYRITDVHCTEGNSDVMGRGMLYKLLVSCCCCCWWCWSHAAEVERYPCSPGCHCVRLQSTFSDSGSRLKAADWHQLMTAYRLQQTSVLSLSLSLSCHMSHVYVLVISASSL